MTKTFFDTFDPTSINLSKIGEKTNIQEWFISQSVLRESPKMSNWNF